MYSIEEYRKAYVEVLEVIKTLDKEDYEKIPKDRIEHMEKEKDKNYVFEYNKDILIKDQVCQLAKGLLTNIFINYIASNDKKIDIERRKMQKENEKNVNNITIKPLFEKENDKKEERNDMVVKKESLLDKILKKIRRFINKIK